MLIPLIDLKNKYNLNIKGVIHIGAYNAEEYPAYMECGVKNVIWIEALGSLSHKLKMRFKDNKTQKVINAIISDKEEDAQFIITNNEASSSLLELGTHLQHHPRVWEDHRELVFTITMDEVILQNPINMNGYNFLNIDIQGAELKALKGIKDNLKHIDYLYLEVNEEEVYKDCCLVGDLDDYLTDFKRVETEMTKYNWGDALYIHKTLL